ncbi:hypothetical protein HQ576_08175 [bacterium]|nr:hypothetical protein [bacterium]
MTKRREDPRTAPAAAPEPAVPVRQVALGLLLVSLVALLWVVAARPLLGVRLQHAYPYHPKPQRSAFLPLVLLGLPLAAVPLLILGRLALTPRRAWALVIVLALSSLALRVGAATAPKVYPGAELALPCLWLNTEGAYAAEVRAARDAPRFLARYADLLDASATRAHARVHHPHVHPPAIILGFAALEALHDVSPGLRAAVERGCARWLPSTSLLRGVPLVPIRHGIAVSATAALLFIAVASLAPLLAFVATRRIWPLEAALAAAALTALVPGTYLFSPSIDQAYPTLTLLLCWLTVAMLASHRRRWLWGAALGVAFYAALFVHVGYGLVGGIIALMALLLWRTRQPAVALGALVKAHARPMAAAAAAFLALALAMRLAFGYQTFRVIALCLRNNARFNAQVGRTWWPWVGVVPFEFALSLGFALALLVAGAWLAEVGSCVRSRALRGRSAALLAVVAVMLALALLGINRGETARLWLFLTPLLVLGVVDALWRHAAPPYAILRAVAAVQVVQVILFAVFLDLGRTANFFLKDLPKVMGQ